MRLSNFGFCAAPDKINIHKKYLRDMHFPVWSFDQFSFATISETQYRLEFLGCLILGIFLGIVAVSVFTAIATRRFKRSNWAMLYAIAGALCLWMISLAFAVNAGIAADYPIARQRYGANSLEHQTAVAEASKVLTAMLFAPTVGCSLGVVLTPKRLPRQRRSYSYRP
jgi:H+/Cl- antiporter ClcA